MCPKGTHFVERANYTHNTDSVNIVCVHACALVSERVGHWWDLSTFKKKWTRQILNGVSFHVNSGQIMGILGNSGEQHKHTNEEPNTQSIWSQIKTYYMLLTSVPLRLVWYSALQKYSSPLVFFLFLLNYNLSFKWISGNGHTQNRPNW